MTKTQLIKRLISLSILLVSISSIATYFQPKIIVNNTSVWWSIHILILCIFFVAKRYFYDRRQSQSMLFVQWYLLWNIFSASRGVFIAEIYWDWKGLVGNTMALLIPVVAYAASNTALMQYILKSYLRYTLPLFLGLVFLTPPGAYGFYLVPIYFLMLFFPLLNLRWKLILLAITLFVITADFGARSNVIKFSVPVLLSLIYYFRLYFKTIVFEWVRKLMFIAPVLLFTLAVTGSFNVFNMKNYIDAEMIDIKINAEGDVVEDDLKADTRTFLYVEVLQTAEKYNTWLIGRSPARGNESESFGMDDMTGRGERLANEVAILNIFTWTGMVGVMLYFLVFYRASYLAINYANNTFSQIMGLFLAFRWMYAWVEDVNNFSLTTFFLWMLIGMCYSKAFRSMTNKDVKCWVQGIFSNKKVVAK